MTPELAQTLASVRLRQTADLLAWMAANHPESGPLLDAHDRVAEALGIIDKLGS